MRILAILMVLLIILVACYYFIAKSKLDALKEKEAQSAKVELERVIEDGRVERKKKIEEMDALSSAPEVLRSILEGIALELRVTGRKDGRVGISVQYTKPEGKTYLVDSLQYACILYIDGKEHGDIGSKPSDGDLRIMLEEGQYFGEWYFRGLEIPTGSEIYVVWVSNNPRTGEVERLRSNKVVVE